ncbi:MULTISPECIES: GntR family transcriptional regulator [Clostridium]|jgi:GntR family transcriptional regulator|uniref:GntR family transcriptional regulator n=1 Tax=Clostridium TaxID=1485 RepID=UPI000BE3DF3C|nr:MULTISPECIES: GntR family transcriptional regulator [Clostridium]MBU6134412.1 GntR family transcriptional regulator [Clostridium tertium]MDB1934319.1 GntR family transcriptional regulator [Clostridium tertium]MDB1935819.1 GntR family transcriptional regulator [Clostridium tertium]MDB1969614.1 GntR family transcriptional regulator [Clostridium tertium]MDU2681702.1 GntR family transcriptional regulator [Clostridium sp.]
MIIIDSKSSTPIYEQITIGIKELILKNVIKSGDKLPSVRELSTILTINPNTVSKAYMELEKQNIVESIKGKGTFITSNYRKPVSEEKLSKLILDFKRLILEANYLGLEENDLILLLDEGFKEIRGGI